MLQLPIWVRVGIQSANRILKSAIVLYLRCENSAVFSRAHMRSSNAAGRFVTVRR